MLRQHLQYHSLKKTTKADRKYKACIKCTQNDVDNVARLELAYCLGCMEMPNHIPASQIKDFIRKRYYETSNE